jgi:hypothetical protein
LDAFAQVAGLLAPRAREGLLVFPAGALRVATRAEQQSAAERIRSVFAAMPLTVVFGIDVSREESCAALNEPMRSFVYACRMGTTLLWPAGLDQRGPVEGRTLAVDGRRVGLLLGSELFQRALDRRLARLEPDLLVLITHAGATPRWQPALARLRATAPLIVAGAVQRERRPSWLAPPPRWTKTELEIDERALRPASLRRADRHSRRTDRADPGLVAVCRRAAVHQHGIVRDGG